MPRLRRYDVVRLADLPPNPCPCGTARRAFAQRPGRVASVHLVEIKRDTEMHHHRRLTETYYVLRGRGHMELDGARVPIGPGMAVRIEPGCRHRAVGRLRILNFCVPAFDPADEWLDESPEKGRRGATTRTRGQRQERRART